MAPRRPWLLDLPGRTPYAEAWALQKRLVAARQQDRIGDGLILLEHPPVITMGRSARAEHLLVPREILLRQGFEVYAVERGGSVTYHGPGQLVGYPILHLTTFDVVGFVRALEETLIRTLRGYGIDAARLAGYPGVWVGDAKIAAVGVAVKRKVTMHGFALNVDPDLSRFAVINPCGLGRPVTSMARLLGRPCAVDEVRPAYRRAFCEVFALDLEPVTADDLDRALAPDAGPAVPA
ncbi:MAG: lipoyl(octanoyl) transferase LipB [Armatimonadota bacterium]|nr:lipoyl(octanoyl) transferase LipB [Armatimonadota bacterium]